MMKYFEKHASFNATVHVLIGLGLGIFVAYYFSGLDAFKMMQWGLAFFIIGVLLHLYPLIIE